MCQAQNYTQIPFVWYKERRRSRLLQGCPPPSCGSAGPKAAVASFKGHDFPHTIPRKPLCKTKWGWAEKKPWTVKLMLSGLQEGCRGLSRGVGGPRGPHCRSGELIALPGLSAQQGPGRQGKGSSRLRAEARRSQRGWALPSRR